MATVRKELDPRRMQRSAGRAGRLMKSLANRDRLLLLCQLAQGERSVGELGEALGIRQPTLSQQLTVLRRQGLVETRREGRRIVYAVRSREAVSVLRAVQAAFCPPRAK